MKEIVTFVVDNWQFIGNVAISIIGFILLFIFKKTKVIDSSAYGDVIEYVKDAEKKFGAGHGKDKFNYVIERIAFTRGIHKFAAIFQYGFLIENVLSTPHKKGEK